MSRDRFLPNNHLQRRVIIETDGQVILYPDLFNRQDSNGLFSDLCDRIQWRQETIQIFGKRMSVPRLTAWYGDEGKFYTYSGIEHHPQPWIPPLKSIKSKVEEISDVTFNSVLLNLYRTGKDSMAWHSDDEPELGKNPIIASVSLGATRRFSLRHKTAKDRKVHLDLTNGCLVLMQGETQHRWQHQIPKTSQSVQPRINLTFRTIK